MPHRLLPLLTDQFQTGDDLGARLGVGRVTVNTLARKLQEEGVPLLISRAGYALQAGTPAPGLVRVSGVLGGAMRYAGTVGSTQDEIRRWADDSLNPAPHGAVVVAERQSSGRGRRGRAWDTAQGNLAFSVLLRGEMGSGEAAGGEVGRGLSLAELSLRPLAVGVALREALGVGGLKWPNDLLAPDGRKLAGILLDADLRGEEVRRAVLGIGVNVAQAPPGAAALHEFYPEQTRARVLAAILAALEYWLYAPAEQVLQAWRECSVTLGRPVQLSSSEQTFLALDVDAHGGLIVQAENGQHQTINAGDVQLVGEWARQGVRK